ncbi:DEAD/DEAH box helicase [Pseudomonas viridiflava]|uniref:DEAD/DEAH box helicase n=1 Tax=Pseudomonas viridiflava TaxID=33069 RepID=UPI000F02E083|nr:DEAD/DEAH box helicase [Pseudomonas viridiflava]
MVKRPSPTQKQLKKGHEEESIESARFSDLLEGVVTAAEHPVMVDGPAMPEGEFITDKRELFKSVFRGRIDVYPTRWTSPDGKRGGYSPACGNLFKKGVCNIKVVPCDACSNRDLLALTDERISRHLKGLGTTQENKGAIGLFPLMPDSTCYLLAVDFDKDNFRQDALAFYASCKALGVPASIELSQSGNGAHIWIFFDRAATAKMARQLGFAIISHACSNNRQLDLKSYDRLFPNQDVMPNGGFGNLIGLPFQYEPRERGCSVFVNEKFQVYRDQWAYLYTIKRMRVDDIREAIFNAVGDADPLDIEFSKDIDDESPVDEPWSPKKKDSVLLSGVLPKSVTIKQGNMLWFENSLPLALKNRLIRLTAFKNKQFYLAQAMNRSVWDIPRLIAKWELERQYFGIPRGSHSSVMDLLAKNSIEAKVEDVRSQGKPIEVSFKGKLRDDQSVAFNKMIEHEDGTLIAPPAFGKTVLSSAVIAHRKVNTLIIVHRKTLKTQWRKSLKQFLGLKDHQIGTVGGKDAKPSGFIDIALVKSLHAEENLAGIIAEYGQIMADECHHVTSAQFETIMQSANVRYVMGMTANSEKRQGDEPIVYMQCGPIRHVAQRAENAPKDRRVVPVPLNFEVPFADDADIQDIFTFLAESEERTQKIAEDILNAYRQGRKIILLTERVSHCKRLAELLKPDVEALFLLGSGQSEKKKEKLMEQLEGLPPGTPHIIIATTSLLGEGFDHPPLDMMALAMPISWRGRVAQVSGRLDRPYESKVDVIIRDYIDTGHPQLLSMWRKRRAGYAKIGFKAVGITLGRTPTRPSCIEVTNIPVQQSLGL